MYDFTTIANLLPFISQCLGSEAEILLCDTEHILYAEQPITDRVTPGNRLGDMERSFLEDETYKTVPYVLNYRALLPSRERLRSSTLFLKDSNGELAGFLTINIRVEGLINARNLMDMLINGGAIKGSRTPARKMSAKPSTPADAQMLNRYEGVNVAIEDIIQSNIKEALERFGVSAERLTTAERQQIVHELDDLGVFLVKGSIADVAKLLSCSEVTVYRYLQQMSS